MAKCTIWRCLYININNFLLDFLSDYTREKIYQTQSKDFENQEDCITFTLTEKNYVKDYTNRYLYSEVKFDIYVKNKIDEKANSLAIKLMLYNFCGQFDDIFIMNFDNLTFTQIDEKKNFIYKLDLNITFKEVD